MELVRNYIGMIDFENGNIDITDPCYDKDIWCRVSKKIFPGKYKCYAYTNAKENSPRTYICQIVSADIKMQMLAEEYMANDEWKEIFSIGVDAGLAGFFLNKPDFNDEEWSRFCDTLFDEDQKAIDSYKFVPRAYIQNYGSQSRGFFTESGYGDGVYSVYAIFL